jgi:hypothetical protein
VTLVQSLAPVIQKPKRRTREDVAADRVPLTLVDRVTSDLELSAGRVPICILVKTQAESNEAMALLKKVKSHKITVRIAPDEVTY